MSKKIMLIDGHSILNRAFYGVPDLTNSEGIHTNALYGFLNIMFRFIDEENPDYITVAFDLSAPTFRHKAYAEYKGTRKLMAPELKQQVPLIKEILTSMNIKIVEMEGFEADDLLGTIAKKCASEGMRVTVISGDRDLLQLAEDRIMIRIPKTKAGGNEVENYLPEDVFALYGVTPTEFIDMKALMGDSSDNIPGAPGIGPKTASAIIQKYHTIDAVLSHADEITPKKACESIKNNTEQIVMSRFLAEININAPIDFNVEDAAMADFYNEKSYELFKRFNFKSLLKRFDDKITAKEPEAAASYKLVTELDEAEAVFAKAVNAVGQKKHIGLCLIYEDGFTAGVSVCTDNETSEFILKQGFITDEYIAGKISDICKEAYASGVRLIASLNIKDVLPAFADGENHALDANIRQEVFADIAVAAYLISPTNDSYDSDTLANEYLGITIPSKAELFGKSTLSESVMLNIDNLTKYACSKAYVAYAGWNVIKTRLEKINCMELFDTLEMPLLFVLSDMEQQGVRVDKQGLVQYGEMLAKDITVLEKEIYDLAGEEFNINSPKQLGVILFEKLGMPCQKKTKSGYSTAADVLEKLAPDYPIVDKILNYRTMTKLKSTYADGLAGYIREDGRIHSKFNQTITATGRISSTEPNLQNIPIRMELGRQIRKVFIPKDGCVLLDADYSQIELRILAHMSGDEKLIEAYNMAEDIHRITASQVFGVPLDEVTPQQRRNAKAVNFGIIYGISSFGLSQDLSISKKEADSYIRQYFETYPSIKAYIDGLVSSAKENGYSVTMYNRRRPIPELSSSNFMQRSFGERIAMNAPIQGTAADIIKLAMINVYNALKDGGYKSKLILQVHDELLVETYIDEIEDVKKIISDGMKNAASLRVPLEIDLQQGNNWFEAH
jgi:DNA polymerase-1